MADYSFSASTVTAFLEKIKHPNFEDYIKQEFLQMKVNNPPEGTFTNFLRGENLVKNRYFDIPCWDHTRVVLTSQGSRVHNHSDSDSNTIIITASDSDSTYIHANFVDGFEDKKKFICTQAPIENTSGDFWKMIWEKNSHIIVSLTNVDDEDKGCYEYWVNDEDYKLVFGRFVVTTLEIEEEFGFIRTQLRLTDITSRESRSITHFWYTNWPDGGTPADLQEFLTLISEVNETQERQMKKAAHHNKPTSQPIVIHCLAGVGRTGTFCVIDNVLDQLRKENFKKMVSLPETVLKIRSQRHSSVITLDQYVFCYKVIEHVLLIEQNKKDHR